MAIPTTLPIKLSDVCQELYGNSSTNGKSLISGAHGSAIQGNFVPGYDTFGASKTLLDFRGYAHGIPDPAYYYMTGGFTSYNGITRWKSAGLNENGSLNTRYVPENNSTDIPNNTIYLDSGIDTVWIGNDSGETLPSGTYVQALEARDSFGIAKPIITAGNTVYSIVPVVGGFLVILASDNGVILKNRDGSTNNSFIAKPFIAASSGGPYPFRGIQLSTGKFVFIGYFLGYDGFSSNGIAMTLSDGNRDTSFTPGSGFYLPTLNGGHRILAVAEQSDGKILVGGRFDSYNANNQANLVRLTTTGGFDTGFDTGSGINGEVNFINVQSDGKILVGGYFTVYNGVSANKIIRLHPSGAIDTSFVYGSGFGDSRDNAISSILIDPLGRILLGGYFTSYNGTAVNNLVRVLSNGSLDTTFIQTGTGFNSSVISISPTVWGYVQTIPTVPTGLAAQSITATGFTLTWNASTDDVGIAGYKVYKNGALYVTTSGTPATYIVSGQTASTNSTWTVAAYDAAGNNSAQSSGLSVTQSTESSGNFVPTLSPLQMDIGFGEAWIYGYYSTCYHASGIEGYQYQYSKDMGQWIFSSLSASNEINFTHYITESGTYRYQVRAKANSGAYSAWSNLEEMYYNTQMAPQ